MESISDAKNIAAGTDGILTIPSLDFGGRGVPLHFLHANGYPPACYRPLLARLTDHFHVFGMLLRPLWPESEPDAIRDWRPFSDDLRRLLGSMGGGPVLAMGHSIGAVVTLRAALMEPALFRAIVLIEPVLLPTSHILQLRLVRALGIANRLNTRIEAALRRRRRFDSVDQLFAGYRRRDVFRYFSDKELRALVEGITRPAPDGGYELVYSPEWEARIYETGIWNDWDIWRGLRSLRVPTLIIRGAETDTFGPRSAAQVQAQNPAIQIVSVPHATHLVPLEQPDAVLGATQKFIRELNAGMI